jgi:ribosomal protein L7Ae-like RNA K-turn-binding protein
MNNQKTSAMLGLAQKAGKVVSGQFAVERSIKSRKVKLLLIASDCSTATKKSYQDQAEYYGVPCYEIFNMELLGSSIGKPRRAALGILDDGFSNAIIKAMKQ